MHWDSAPLFNFICCKEFTRVMWCDRSINMTIEPSQTRTGTCENMNMCIGARKRKLENPNTGAITPLVYRDSLVIDEMA